MHILPIHFYKLSLLNQTTHCPRPKLASSFQELNMIVLTLIWIIFKYSLVKFRFVICKTLNSLKQISYPYTEYLYDLINHMIFCYLDNSFCWMLIWAMIEIDSSDHSEWKLCVLMSLNTHFWPIANKVIGAIYSLILDSGIHIFYLSSVVLFYYKTRASTWYSWNKFHIRNHEVFLLSLW
jgi:hypothetical protein